MGRPADARATFIAREGAVDGEMRLFEAQRDRHRPKPRYPESSEGP